jgi:desulfoferrodoxin (superoxide reductase-like protein)
MKQNRRDFLRSVGLATAGVSVMSFLAVDAAFADKSSVSIEAPTTVTKGSEITIRVTTTHNANNFLHYTAWLYVMINDEEIARWDYTWRKRPDGKTFTNEIKHTVTDIIEIKAEASCNLHGSKGPATFKVFVK